MTPKQRLITLALATSLSLTGCAKSNEDSDKNNKALRPNALILAVHAGDYALTEYLLKARASVNNAIGNNENQLTPLFIAVAHAAKEAETSDRAKIVSLLKNYGANPFISFKGYSALDIAISANNDNLIKTLIINQ